MKTFIFGALLAIAFAAPAFASTSAELALQANMQKETQDFATIPQPCAWEKVAGGQWVVTERCAPSVHNPSLGRPAEAPCPPK